MAGQDSTNYNRVVIVDPQLKDCKGHNYRYAKGIAAELGLPAVVLSHRQFADDEDDSLDIRPVLTFDQYNNSAFKDSFKLGFLERLGRYKNHYINRVTQSNGVWEQDSPLGIVIAFLAKVLVILLFFPALFNQLTTLFIGRGSSAHRDTTALELMAAFKSLKLKQGDLVVFQTMMWPTFESLLELRIQANRVFDCDALFIMHEDWLIYSTGFIRYTPARFEKRVLQALPFNRAKVLSTNKPLSDYCQQWSGYRPEVVKEIEFPLEDLPQRPGDERTRKCILIPGVYRGDKNFEYVGVLIREISQQYKDIEFCLHESVMARVALPSQYGDQYSVYSDVAGAQHWLEFLSGFDLILLPYGDAYRHRISGIIHEARLLNVPVICHKNIADASLLADSRCLFGDNAEGIKQAVKVCLSVDQEHGFYHKEYPATVARLIVDKAGWVTHIDKPIAVQVKPLWTRCGTSTVLDAQMDYLVDRNFFVIEIYLKSEPWVATAEQVDFLWQVMRGGREYSGGMAVRLLLKDVKAIPLSLYVIKVVRGRIPAFFKRENIHHSWCKPDAALSRFIRTNEVDVALVNHMFHSDFAYKYISAKKYICETHDIQINQLLLRRPELQSNYNNELSYELNVLKQYDVIVNLNRVEHKLIEQRLGNKAYYIQPPIVERDITIRYESLSEFLIEQSKYSGIHDVPEMFDLLIIADGHPANIESVNNFIENVFAKLPEGTTLGLVGKVAGFLNKDTDDDSFQNRVYPIGFVQYLANIYDFTKIVILPDIIGEGVPIKSNEAIAKKVPFVATLHALRGFSQAELKLAGISPVTSNEEMRQSIIDLLASDVSRQKVCEQLELLIERHGLENYFNKWDDVINFN